MKMAFIFTSPSNAPARGNRDHLLSSSFFSSSGSSCPFPLSRSSSLRKNEHARCRFFPLNMSSVVADSALASRTGRGMLQHKREAFWFYAWLSIVYDVIVNPFHWTVEMRDKALQQAGLDNPDLVTVDVGGGTGFCTQGIVKKIKPENVTLLDQSPQQMSYAKKKQDLQGIQLVQGDAESLPFDTDSCDRYVSAGSIEYWPEPQRGICEAYRVLKKGGMATVIGPVRATNPVSRFFCDLWMLFPMESEYRDWFAKAGFEDVHISFIGPKHYRGVRQHGLIMGLTVTGTKKRDGLPPIDLGPPLESRASPITLKSRLLFPLRFLLGNIAGFYYFVLPFFIMLYAAIFIRKPKDGSY